MRCCSPAGLDGLIRKMIVEAVSVMTPLAIVIDPLDESSVMVPAVACTLNGWLG